jgi:hypothetical protein
MNDDRPTATLLDQPTPTLVTSRSARPERPRVMSLEQMATVAPIMPTEPVPDRFRQRPRDESSLYVTSESEPEVSVVKERVPGDKPIWRIAVQSSKRALPGLAVQSVERTVPVTVAGRATTSISNFGYRPPWVGVDYFPKIIPRRRRGFARYAVELAGRLPPVPMTLMEAHEAVSTFYPWRTIGKVFVGNDPNFRNESATGTGVLVGPNLMMTASHMVPWEESAGFWWMRFAPGFREGEPNGSSFVTRVRGIRNPDADFEASGYDYVICQLQQPMGEHLGWMGTQCFGDEDAYTSARWISVGYPGWFFNANRPTVEFDIDIDDIDNDDPGLELEITDGHAGGQGWSGGPLWGVIDNDFRVIGIRSGTEKDGLDPRRGVFSGGRHMVDLVKHGLLHFK